MNAQLDARTAREAVGDMAGGGKDRGRRPNGDGTIYEDKPRGRWVGQVSLDNGKRHTVYGKTQREVAEKLRQLNRDRDRGLNVAPERMTVATYLTQWLEGRRALKEESTWIRDEAAVRLYLIPEFGKMTLAKLTSQPARIEATYARWRTEAGPRGDKPIAKATLARVHAVLHTALRDAERLDYVPRNVAGRVSMPKAERRDATGRAWTPEQAQTFIDACASHPLGNLFIVAVTTGLRPQELQALHWADVDLECGTITVRAKLTVKIGWSYAEESGAKTAAGMRTFRANETTITALRAQRATVKRLQLAAPRGIWQEHDLIFPSEIGTHLPRGRYVREFDKLQRASGLPDIRPYDLRHTAATIAMQSGAHVNDVAVMLGHAKPSITMDVYGHASPGAGQAAEGIERALAKVRAKGQQASS